MAAVGAKVMHPRAVEIGELYGVRIHVRSSFHQRPGTMIVAELPMEERNRVRGVAHESNVAKITVMGVPDRPGVAAAIFEPLAEAGISVDVIVQNVSTAGPTDLPFTRAHSDPPHATQPIQKVAPEIGPRAAGHAGGGAHGPR